ncbi:DUF7172 family protein [Mycolicibacterium goodii]|uniref:DUF7172 domain-containing protein n=1 Tax=Mycolicibacterium goodii TaxID=134601 RepID=A0ABS6HN36_MYCGD|nr:hypothetical protein [Mycolicibacterium goodii]YP_009013583.1 hypothetical protein DORI_33 [Mycobacterium phage Dori]UVT31465.1 hypothetical protein SEA_SEJANUS_32 [Mycobacterium phage Sejanus]UVT31565.1 hypothetical protein SEA_MASK_32 [Mycobacterium phage Mask]AER47683.1 hypothetical protein DORI_33 [Mycobacterium phage Dori]MBU8824104.1 hypothetical protein [Mycolicibacterium goodii]MBU8838113.1 hypothetical protein [Mycolicibacterium goodii]
MSIRLCTAEHMLSTVDGLDMRRTWFPRVVAERFLESTKDGKITRAPDPVLTINGDVTWYNNNPDAQLVWVQVNRAPRSIVAQNPSTVVIHDAWTWAKGRRPVADYPSVTQDAFGGRAQIDRPEAAADAVKFGRLYIDGESSQAQVPIGEIGPRESLHFRYTASVQTPNTWTAPSEYEPRWETQARWARLIVLASPVGAS